MWIPLSWRGRAHEAEQRRSDGVEQLRLYLTGQWRSGLLSPSTPVIVVVETDDGELAATEF